MTTNYKLFAGRLENVVGWYHSHPGYGCWLSGIDCSTQMLNQQFQEPFLAVVVDPTRTVTAGKVEIGAFRSYPDGYKPPDEPLDVSYFKSSLDTHLLDLLWNKYWVNTLSSSPLLANRDYVAGQISDLAEKLEQAENQLHTRVGSFYPLPQKKKGVIDSRFLDVFSVRTLDKSSISGSGIQHLLLRNIHPASLEFVFLYT
ncbi:proteasome regulatory particle subunit RPN11 [Ranunculus cassubicifolius]